MVDLDFFSVSLLKHCTLHILNLTLLGISNGSVLTLGLYQAIGHLPLCHNSPPSSTKISGKELSCAQVAARTNWKSLFVENVHLKLSSWFQTICSYWFQLYGML